jgi:hypothetical protein
MIRIFDRISANSLPRITKTEIVCGDCAGSELLPIRTNLTATGACAACGGRSFVTAAPLAQALSRQIQNTRKEENYEQRNQNGKTTGNLRRIK